MTEREQIGQGTCAWCGRGPLLWGNGVLCCVYRSCPGKRSIHQNDLDRAPTNGNGHHNHDDEAAGR